MIRPRKRFGQHFLTDNQVITNLVNAIAPLPTDHLVEIGPGLGALTFPLLNKINRLDVIEIDRDIIPKLLNHPLNKGKLTIHESDVLEFDFAKLASSPDELRIVGNLPYNISTPLIFHLLTYACYIKDMCFMLQKEVVERITADKNTKHYGRLSIMVQYYCAVTPLFIVKPNAFNPPPEVDSQIIKLIPYKQLPFCANNFSHFEMIVKKAFSMRRKSIRNSLKTEFSLQDFELLNINTSARPEELSVEQFVKLSNLKNN